MCVEELSEKEQKEKELMEPDNNVFIVWGSGWVEIEEGIGGNNW